MKNSLFKRVVAAAAAVPMALTQCLTVNTFAVEDADIASAAVAADNSITLGDLLYIAGSDKDQASDWNLTVDTVIDEMINNGKNSGVIDPTSIYKKIIARSGEYAKLVEDITKCIGNVEYLVDDFGDVYVTAKLSNAASAFESVAMAKVSAALDELKAQFADHEELLEDLENVKFFEDVVIAGEFKITSTLSNFDLSKEFETGIVFTDAATGKEYKNLDIGNYVQEKLVELEASATKTLDDIIAAYDLTDEDVEELVRDSDEYKELIDKYSQPITLTKEEVVIAVKASEDYNNLVADLVSKGLTEEQAKEEIEKSEDYQNLIEEYSKVEINLTREEVEELVINSQEYKDKMTEIQNEYDETFAKMSVKIREAETELDDIIVKIKSKIFEAWIYYNKSFSGEYNSFAELVNAVNAKIAAKGWDKKLAEYGFDSKIPASGAAIAANPTVVEYFEKAVNKIESIAPVTVDIEAAELGEFLDSLSNISVSYADGTATFSAQFPDAEIDEVREYLASQGKELAKDDNGNEIPSYKKISVTVESGNLTSNVKTSFDIVRVMETETVQTTTTTSTTTSTTTTTTTSDTTTSSTNSGICDSTTSTTTTSSTTTSTDTTTSSSTTTSTDTTTSSSTTTSTDTTTSSSTTSSSTTTSTDTTTSTTTTTYVAVAGVYVDIEAEDGFYTNIDDSFAKEQVSNLSLFVKYNTISVDENGIETIVDESVSSAYDITGSFKFSTTPGAAYDSSKTSFLYDIGLLYNGMDIVDQYGNTVITDGAILRTSTDGIVTVPAYIGLKGDADLDNKITSRDAAMVLDYYANLSSGADAATIEFSVDSDLVSGPDSIYDDFAAFLADVDTAIDPSVAWKTGKSGRRLLASDAGAILTYYAYIQNAEPGKAAWSVVLGNTQA